MRKRTFFDSSLSPLWLARAAILLCLAFSSAGCECGVPIGSARGDGGMNARIGPRTDECGNGLDDDGNDRIDDGCPCGPGETQRCFSGALSSNETGACRSGIQTCAVAPGGEWSDWGLSACEGETLPGEETCDGTDADCDGAVDEGCPCTNGMTSECGAEFVTAPCTAGVQTCRAGAWSSCEGAVGPSPDVCRDGIDNDCDGELDDGCDCVPSPEVCRDGIDNDCDHEIDELACTPDWEPADAGMVANTDAGMVANTDAGTVADAGVGPCTPAPLSRWTTISRAGEPPTGIWRDVNAWTGREILFWGGRSTENESLGTGGRYDPAADRWRPITDTGAPRRRSESAWVWTGTQLFVWGGYDAILDAGAYRIEPLDDGGMYDPAADRWTPIASDPLGPSTRFGGPVVAWTGSEVVLWGGLTGVGATPVRDGGFYNPVTGRWRAMPLGPSMLQVGGGWARGRLWVFGYTGTAGTPSTFRDVGYTYDDSTGLWEALPASPAGVRFWSGNVVVVTAQNMIVHGRLSGAVLDFDTMTWSAIPAPPTSRELVRSFWTGCELLFFGDLETGDPTYNDYRYDPASRVWATLPALPFTRVHRPSVNWAWAGNQLVGWGTYSTARLVP